MAETKLSDSTRTNFKFILIGILLIQASLAFALYNSIIHGFASLSQLWFGLSLLSLGAFLSVYQFGLKQKRFVLFDFR